MQFRNLHEGMGQAVAERTILRKLADTDGHVLTPEEVQEEVQYHWETWGQVADRVALGNSMLVQDDAEHQQDEYEALRYHIAMGTTLMSGRHLQHGDEDQPNRNMEVFTNCATAATTFLLFYLLLNGSGVGRCYDDDMCVVNWDNAPTVRCVLAEEHPDFDYSAHESVRDAKHKYGTGKGVMWFQVPDSREGWAKALEIWEIAAFQQRHAHKMLILDFSLVREKGAPIGGMQNRPASGPVPLMNAFEKAMTMKGAGLDPWMQAMYIDHYFAECVLVGGARRAARMSTKHWRDRNVLDFITIKRPIEYHGMKCEDILAYRKKLQSEGLTTPDGFLWSSNNSVMADDDFWRLINLSKKDPEFRSEDAQHARRVFRALTEASYGDGTGEPGLINAHKMVQNDMGYGDLRRGDYVGSPRYEVETDTEVLLGKLARNAKKKRHYHITNPCGEITLNLLGAFCVIADVVPYHAKSLDEAEEAFRVTTRALIRTNLMKSVYDREVKRTNRIGVGMTGVHEFAFKFFGLDFKDLLDEEKSKDFWLCIARFHRAVREEAASYCTKLGVEIPHTMFTIKPAGTTSKLFGLTEGWHLPSMREYLRWVQFNNGDPLIAVYKAAGYPVRELKTSYRGMTIVGFPTAPEITKIMPGERIVTAAEATPDEQYRWIALGEKYWIVGTDEEGKPLSTDVGNQISYTLKYNPELVDFKHFRDMLKKHQGEIRCCSVMPQEDVASYEYQPEEALPKAEYEQIIRNIKRETVAHIGEDVGKEHVGCDNGACPVDFATGAKNEIGG